MSLVQRLAVVLSSLVLTPVLAAQSEGPGLGNLTYSPSELYKPISVVHGPNGYGMASIVHGWFLTVSCGDNPSVPIGIELWDFSDPRNPQLAHRIADANSARLLEDHGFALSGNSYGGDYLALQASDGVQIWDVTDPPNAHMVGEAVLPNIAAPYGSIWWLFWQPPYLYAAGTSTGLYVIRADDPSDPQYVKTLPPSEISGIAPNQVFVQGDLMVLVRSQQLGFGTFDLRDPENPEPLDYIPGAQGYSHVFAAGDILTCGGDGGPVVMSVHSVSHDGKMSLLGMAGAGYGFSNGGYGSYQDGHFHAGMSSDYVDFDVNALSVVGFGRTNIANRDEDFGQVLGNVAFVGDDHAVGSGVYAHDVLPDSHGPDVHWVWPADGATGVPEGARVGLSMSDNVDFTSVDGTTFQVRPLGGTALPGKYSVQMGLVNFTPDAGFAPDTVYEVLENGIEDLVGNSGAVFRSTFTTGNGVPSGPPIQNLAAKSGKPYRTGTMANGALIYVDRDYAYAQVPARLVGQPYVLTANDDKSSTGSSFLTFQIPAASLVDVLYDQRATQLPTWLSAASGWTPTGETVAGAGGYVVYEKGFPAGLVALGGNAAPPAMGASSNYGVVVIPSGIPPACSTPAVAVAETGETVQYTIPPATGTPPLTYTWSFGDGTPPTQPSASPDATHVFAGPGHFPVSVHVTNPVASTACSALQIVHTPATAVQPAASTTIVHTGALVACVNPDHDTASALDPLSLQPVWEAPVGRHPRTLAVAPSGELWVVNEDDASISVLRTSDGALQRTIPLPRASRPYGIAFAPDQSAAFVTLQGGTPASPAVLGGSSPSGRATGFAVRDALAAGRFQLVHLLRLDPASGEILGGAVLEGKVRGIVIPGDSSRVFVARFLSPSPATEGAVWELDARTLELVATHTLAFDPGPDTERSGRGVPNYLGALAISPDGRRLVVPSKKDNRARGLYRSGEPLTFESRTRTIVSQIDLATGQEDLAARIDLNDRDMAQSIAFSPLGDLFVVGLQGTNVADVFDAATGTQYGTWRTGRAPQGLVFSPSGDRLFVQDFLGRSITVLDTSEVVAGITYTATELARVRVAQGEPLVPDVYQGKRIFYDADDRRMNLDGYIACASCHLDGDSDGQVWDFTQTGEGLRNTIVLEGRAGLGHGNVHWTANFDEIQDFENDIRDGFQGAGFLLDAQFQATMNPLGPPKAGLSLQLDQLAAYVSSLDTFPQSPFRDQDGSLTPDGVAGQRIFQRLGCATCHVPPTYQDDLRHDVGTIVPGSGQGIGQPLAGVGFDTPTLRGIWDSAPYLHAGQAPTLLDVLDSATHGGTDALTPRERAQLALYLLQLE